VKTPITFTVTGDPVIPKGKKGKDLTMRWSQRLTGGEIHFP
jgi:hypothetical protein